MVRYKVNFKNFTTGEWHTKTDADSYAAAKSVALTSEGYGRACKMKY